MRLTEQALAQVVAQHEQVRGQHDRGRDRDQPPVVSVADEQEPGARADAATGDKTKRS